MLCISFGETTRNKRTLGQTVFIYNGTKVIGDLMLVFNKKKLLPEWKLSLYDHEYDYPWWLGQNLYRAKQKVVDYIMEV